MYHEEKVINGVLHHRGTPWGKFTPYSAEQLTKKLLEVRNELENALDLIDEYRESKEF